MSDVPSFSEFNPHVIPYQFRVLRDIGTKFDYQRGTHEVLLSGSVGSAKSVLMAHVALCHAVKYPKSRFLLGRLTMPDLKETILQTVLDHMEGDFVEGEDYKLNQTRGKITFSNGSEIISRSWADKKFKKFRSLKLSGAAIEELTENTEEYKSFYTELMTRMGRLPHVPENIVISATNPDAPSHWAYRHFVVSDINTRHVYYSRTEDNPFLPRQYIEQLKRDLDPKMARRLLYGEWIEITSEIVYHSYDRAVNFKNEEYEVDPAHPIRISHDFNIGAGKPMSATVFQYIPSSDSIHFFREFVVEGARTQDIMEEIGASGLLERPNQFVIHGDASGKNRDTRSKRTDYDIIEKFMSNFSRLNGSKLDFEMKIPLANPPVRKRHNLMNAYFGNALGQTRAFVYRGCTVTDEGFRLTKLKKGGNYVEDDSPAYQHITTACGYGLISAIAQFNRKPQGMEDL